MKNFFFVFALFLVIACTNDKIDLDEQLSDITTEIKLKGARLAEDQVSKIQQDLLKTYMGSEDFDSHTAVDKTSILQKGNVYYLRTFFSNGHVATSLIDIDKETAQLTFLGISCKTRLCADLPKCLPSADKKLCEPWCNDCEKTTTGIVDEEEDDENP